MVHNNVDSKVANFWDHESHDWGQKYGRNSSYFYRRKTFYEFLAETGLERAKILDYGCGSGDITFPMLRAGHTVTGVDIAEKMARKASERAEQVGLAGRGSYHHLDDTVLSRISAEKYDVIVCSSVLEYVDDDRALLRMFNACLNAGGFLLISVPDIKSIFCRIDKWMYANKTRLPSYIPAKKLEYLDIQKRQYDIEAFVQELEGDGFELLRKKHNSITLQRGLLMEKASNIQGVGMLALLMFRKK